MVAATGARLNSVGMTEQRTTNFEPNSEWQSGKVVFGMQLPVQSQSTIYVEDWERDGGPPDIAKAAKAAEEGGFYYVGVSDHTAIPRRLSAAMSTTWYDPVATLSWVAAMTSKLRLLTYVYIAALRHPLRAAKELATLDRLSDGRLIVGVGAGHVPEEFALMDTSFEDRGALTDEAIDAISVALTEEFPVLKGPRWVASDLGVAPRPVQQPHPPIWVGGSTRAALRRAAARADGWLPQTAKRPELAAQIRELSALRDELRGGTPMAVGALAGAFHVGDASWDLPRGTVQGTPEQLSENLSELVAMGATHLHVRFPSRSVEELCDQMAAFAEQVMPLMSS
jgi:probable F420-dependent oxidoreductase